MVWLREKERERDGDMAVIFCLLEILFQVWNRMISGTVFTQTPPPRLLTFFFFPHPFEPGQLFQLIFYVSCVKGGGIVIWEVHQIAEVGKSGCLADSSCLSALLIITLSAFIGTARGVELQMKAPLIARWVASVSQLMSAVKGSSRLGDECEVKWLRVRRWCGDTTPLWPTSRWLHASRSRHWLCNEPCAVNVLTIYSALLCSEVHVRIIKARHKG